MASAIIRRGMATSAAVESAIKHVTVIGGGLMGSGIAQVSVSHRFVYESMRALVRARVPKRHTNYSSFDRLNLLRKHKVHSPPSNESHCINLKF